MTVRYQLPKEFLRNGKRSGTSVVATVGDSITRARGSADWVSSAANELGDSYDFVNAGVDGNLAWNVLQRLDVIIRCRPDFVTLLVGTNDIQATVGPSMERMYRRQQRIPQSPSLRWYVENLDAILDRLQGGTDARIGVFTIPPLGEDLTSPENQKVDRYNEAIARSVSHRRLKLLPLHERLIELLPAGRTPPPYTPSVRRMVSSMLRHQFLRRSWNSISASNGLSVLTDQVHLNDRAGKAAAELAVSFIRQDTTL